MSLTSASLYDVCFVKVEFHKSDSSPLKTLKDAYKLTAATRDGFSFTRRQSSRAVSVKYYASKICFSFICASRAKRSRKRSEEGNVTENYSVNRILYSMVIISYFDTALSVTLRRFFSSGG